MFKYSRWHHQIQNLPVDHSKISEVAARHIFLNLTNVLVEARQKRFFIFIYGSMCTRYPSW